MAFPDNWSRRVVTARARSYMLFARARVRLAGLRVLPVSPPMRMRGRFRFRRGRGRRRLRGLCAFAVAEDVDGLAQWGQAKVLIFHYARLRHLPDEHFDGFADVGEATVEGVVTTTAPVTATVWISVSCTSPVPGGRSMMRWSSSPHCALRRNFVITLCQHGTAPDHGLVPG